MRHPSEESKDCQDREVNLGSKVHQDQTDNPDLQDNEGNLEVLDQVDNQDQTDNPDLLDQRVQAGLKATEDNLERVDRRDLEENLAWLDHQEELEVREHLDQLDYKYKNMLFSLMYICLTSVTRVKSN